jgi:hypothetical protein
VIQNAGWEEASMNDEALDRLDSVIFAAPVFFHVTRYLWTP